MSGISDALISSANHMRALERSLSIIQSNVGGASRPGYARQDLVGIESVYGAGGVQQISSRDDYAEHAVRQQNSMLGLFDQMSSVLRLVEPNFAASADAQLPKAISGLFGAFSALTTNPNDMRSRQLILDKATQLGRTFNSVANTLQNVAGQTRIQIAASVSSINRLATLVRDFNVKQVDSGSVAAAAAIDAGLYASLEEISEFADVQLLRQNDGSLTLLLGGQTALVVGQNLYPIEADLTSLPAAIIRDANGGDITSNVTGGRLAGALQTLNQLLPSYRDGLNRLAQGIADSVNAALAAGVDSNGVPGAPLFTYQTPNIAATLAITGITAGQLAAATPGAPGGNGNALALAALETSPSVGGLTFSEFYGDLTAGVGRDVANARDSQSLHKQLLAQARALRSESSGVSLDEEAIRLVEYQRAYQATAKLVAILDQLTQVTINMIR